MATATQVTAINAFIAFAIKQDHTAIPAGTYDLSATDAVQFGVFPNPPTSPATSDAFVALGPWDMQIADEGTPLGKLTHTVQLQIEGWASITLEVEGGRLLAVGNLANDVVAAVYTSARTSGEFLFDLVRNLHFTSIEVQGLAVKAKPTYGHFKATIEYVYESTQGDGV